jgi:hypothetical protein
MYKEIKNIKNKVHNFFTERQKYKQFYSKVQDVMIDALLEKKQSIEIKDRPISFPVDSQITEIIYCLTQQLELPASWRYVQKNNESYVLLIRFGDQEFAQPKVTDKTKISFQKTKRIYDLAVR